MPTSLGLHGLYAPRFAAGATKWVSNYEARYRVLADAKVMATSIKVQYQT